MPYLKAAPETRPRVRFEEASLSGRSGPRKPLLTNIWSADDPFCSPYNFREDSLDLYRRGLRQNQNTALSEAIRHRDPPEMAGFLF
jgi:hypothetical protein